MIKDFLFKFKKFNSRVVKIVQNILIKFFLFVIYYLGFGLTYIFVLILKPKTLFIKKPKESNWKISSPISENLKDYYNQS